MPFLTGCRLPESQGALNHQPGYRGMRRAASGWYSFCQGNQGDPRLPGRVWNWTVRPLAPPCRDGVNHRRAR